MMDQPNSVRRGRGRPRKEEARFEPRADLFWRNGRAYGEFRAWKGWGGKREPLVPSGDLFATKDPNTAVILFGERLQELRTLRVLNPQGLPKGDLQWITPYLEYHVAELAASRGRKQPTDQYVENLRFRLGVAAEFFESRGIKELRAITAAHLHEYVVHLRTYVPKHHTMKREQLSRTTQRQYIDALGHMLQRAVSEGRIVKNWVREKIDLPTAAPSNTELLELGECALLLEAARRLFPSHTPGRPIYPLLAFMLFTGCSESERAGVELRDLRLPGDPEYPQGVVFIRPNASRRRLKTSHRERVIPIQPQLGEILVEYLNGPNAPRGPLLFPDAGSNGAVPVGDWRKTLDQIAHVAGYARGTVRTRRFRVSFATHRLCTLDERGLPMTAWALRGEIGHGTEQMIERRYGRYARYRGRNPVLEFRWATWKDRCRDRLALGLASILPRSQHRTLAVLASYGPGLSLVDWQRLRKSNPGTFFPHRDRLVQLGLVTSREEDGIRRYAATEDGHAVFRAHAVDPAVSV